MNKKVCKRCNKRRNVSSFSNNKHKADGLQSYCKTCMKANWAKAYRAKPSYYKTRTLDQKREKREWLWSYKENHPCVRCGESHPACLQFHHLAEHKKIMSLSHAANHGWSIAHLKKEIVKCIVLCANCHAKEHSSY